LTKNLKQKLSLKTKMRSEDGLSRLVMLFKNSID